MTTRAERVGNERPRRPPRAPLPRDWREVLDEIESDLGLELAMLVRQVRLVAERGPEERCVLVRPRHVVEREEEANALAPADLHADLRILADGLRQPRPHRQRRRVLERLARACAAIAEWAETAGYPSAAVQFAEAGAAVLDSDPYAAFVAGRTNRLMGEGWRAEIYYERAIRTAYRKQRWDAYIRAHLGWGTLLSDQGDLPGAAEHYYSAATAARDQGLEWLAAQTYHDLMGLYFEAGDVGRAREFGMLAVGTYPRHNKRRPIAVHDLAFLFVVEHRYREALPLLELLLALPLQPQEQVLVCGSLARAAGSLGDAERFGDAETRVLHLAPHHDHHADAAYVNLAFGAYALGDAARAVLYADRGITTADQKGHASVARVGRDLLAQIRMGTPLPHPAEVHHEPGELNALLGTLRVQLIGWRTSAWTPRTQYGAKTLGPV